jgi:hypothetical protein
MDAERILKRFEEEKVRFEINCDDSAMRNMSPTMSFLGGYYGNAQLIQIFVHRDDKEKAKAIVNEGSQV